MTNPKMQVDISNVFINFLPNGFTKENLETLCSPFGKIISAKVMINLSTGTSRGFGFVRFSNRESAQRCINHLNGYQIGNKKLLARLTTSMENVGIPSHSIYIKSLPLSYEKAKLWSTFEKFGHICGIELVINPKTGIPKGSAYITYLTQEEATRAIHEMNNVILEADGWPLFIRYTDKEVMDKQFVRSGIIIEMPKRKENNSQIGNSTQLKCENGNRHTTSNSERIPTVDTYESSQDDLYRQLLEDIENEENHK